ncbi:MAG: integration host factor subunit beta [Spirochaetaceae bacterium]|jgi:integration host factor subunit beta|nr:integration host factor subunit beta [Spirochaetaceae bacterium]GMO29543.1 MAG: integration host factor subunit alpha [Termitinemataceae bacterium]
MPDAKCRKADIIEAVYMQTGFNKNHIKTVYEIIFSEIKKALVDGKTIELRGMGTFEPKIRNARKKARNPRTGEIVPAYQHRAVCFRPGQDLKMAVWSIPKSKDAE